MTYKGWYALKPNQPALLFLCDTLFLDTYLFLCFLKKRIFFHLFVVLTVCFFGFVLFYGISTFVRYLMPNPVYTHILDKYIYIYNL